jgi:hypothetical protein
MEALYMKKDKTETMKRRIRQKMKYGMKKAGFDLALLRREIYGYQFGFTDQQPSWTQLLPQAVLHQCSRPMNKEQQHRTMEGNHDQ